MPWTTSDYIRVIGILACGFGTIARGAAYSSPTAPSGHLTTFVDTWIPLNLWAVVWIVTGAFVISGLWSSKVARNALSVSASLWLVWAISYFGATWFADASRGWVTGAAMLQIAVMTWVFAAWIEPLESPDTGPEAK